MKCKSRWRWDTKVSAGVGMFIPSTFFILSSNRFLPCTAGFFVLTDHKYLILVLAQMVEHSDRQQKKKDPVKIKVRMVQAPVPPELVTA